MSSIGDRGDVEAFWQQVNKGGEVANEAFWQHVGGKVVTLKPGTSFITS